MKYIFIAFSCLLLTKSNAKSQNLVSNPSFEIYVDCPEDYTVESIKMLVPNWYLPTKGTSDYFNSCSRLQVNVPENFIGHMYAKNGQAYAGFILYKKPQKDSLIKISLNYREYLQTKLNKTLLPGKSYEVKFYYAVATYSTYAINNIGIDFSKKKIKSRHSKRVLKYSPQIKANIKIY